MKPIRAWLSRALTTALALALLLTGLSPGALAAGVPPDDSPPGNAEEVSAAALYARRMEAEICETLVFYRQQKAPASF